MRYIDGQNLLVTGNKNSRHFANGIKDLQNIYWNGDSNVRARRQFHWDPGMLLVQLPHRLSSSISFFRGLLRSKWHLEVQKLSVDINAHILGKTKSALSWGWNTLNGAEWKYVQMNVWNIWNLLQKCLDVYTKQINSCKRGRHNTI